MLLGQATELTEEHLMGYFFAGLHSNIRIQIRPHNFRDLLRAIEIARDVEEVSTENRVGERTTNRSRGYQNNYHGSGGVISRVETLKGTRKEPGSSGNVHILRKEGETIMESKVGSNDTRSSRNRG
ncbi:hypothetical protein V8G54_025196 [Vigna mungo]|uniref:Uncharacterized protein n=1 Tax=Vigna mungo TaxID=3915 RepID=A0AAQ3N8L8_VIGMU